LARAGVNVAFSCGFNPHPRISLPLPRSVGVESEDELLCVRVKVGEAGVGICETPEQIRAKLAAELPAGFELLSACIDPAGAAPQVKSVDYVFTLCSKTSDAAAVKVKIEQILACDSLKISRQTDDEGSVKSVDIRAFIDSLAFDGSSVTARCRITAGGTVRPQEILALLELKPGQLSAPIRRCRMQWE